MVRAASTLEDEFERLRDEVWLVVILAFTAVRAASTLDDELDIEFELALISVSEASTLEEELDRLREDI